MDYLTFLGSIHQKFSPTLYLEIGCANGSSLSKAECRSIGIDPDYNITAPCHAATNLYRETSDDFFKRPNVRSILGRPIDMAFIDGMHLSEFALRDFMNIEALSHRNAIIIVDDVCPERMEIASRHRSEIAWTGDVYKLLLILKKYRSDLEIQVASIPIKGMAVIQNLDPTNRELEKNAKIISEELSSGFYDLDTHAALLEVMNPKTPELILELLK